MKIKRQWRVYYQGGAYSRPQTKLEAQGLLYGFSDALYMEKFEGWFKRRIFKKQ